MGDTYCTLHNSVHMIFKTYILAVYDILKNNMKILLNHWQNCHYNYILIRKGVYVDDHNDKSSFSTIFFKTDYQNKWIRELLKIRIIIFTLLLICAKKWNWCSYIAFKDIIILKVK